MNAPFLFQTNPKASYQAHQAEIQEAIARTLESGWFILGAETEAFEKAFAEFLGVSDAVGVGNGTDALVVALRACGVEPGDAVLTVAHTAVATVAAIELAGALPVLVDIDPQTFTMDPDSLEATICAYQKLPAAERAPLKAVVVVHLYGHPAQLPSIVEITRRHGLALIEDCAQSHGARFSNQQTGTWGDAAAFSFYPTKNLGALGDGGAVVSRHPEIAAKARLLREYGWKERYVSLASGMNTRLDELQSAILRVKLRYLEEENTRRRALAEAYHDGLEEVPVVLPEATGPVRHVFHQYVIRTEARDALRKWCQEHGVGTLVHYPVPVHLQPAYEGRLLMAPDGLPHTEQAAREVLSLPMYPQLGEADVHRAARTIGAFFTRAE